MEIKIKIINQLSDNYTYVIYNSKDKIAVVVDPAESKPIIEYLQKNNLLLVGMLITHHHSDHTSGIKDLLKINKKGSEIVDTDENKSLEQSILKKIKKN